MTQQIGHATPVQVWRRDDLPVSQNDSTGLELPQSFDTLPQTLTYNADNTLRTIVVTNGTNNWTQTMSYTAGNLTSISGWVKS